MNKSNLYNNMKKAIKSIFKATLILVFCMSLILVTGESDNMVSQMVWTIACMSVMVASGIGIIKFFPEIFTR